MRRKNNLEERSIDAFPYLIECGNDSLDARQQADSIIKLPFERDHYELELGCGKGKFALEYALKNPQVEQITNVIIVGAEKAKQKEILNLCFLRSGAEYLKRYFESGFFDNIYLNFPCPFHKETYRNRRLTSPDMLSIYNYLLREGGEIRLKTDNKRMFEYSIESLSACGYLIKDVTLDLYASKYVENNIATEYEAKYTSQGAPIMRLVAVKPKS